VRPSPPCFAIRASPFAKDATLTRRARAPSQRRTAAAPRREVAGVMRAGVAQRVVAMLRERGDVDVAPLLDGVGLSPVELANADRMVSLARGLGLLEAAAQATGDATFGITLAARLAWQDLGVLGYVLLNSPTIGAAFGNLRRYQAVHQSRGSARLEVAGRTARVVRVADHVPPDEAPQSAELVIALYARLCRDGTGDATWNPRAVHFRHRRPRSVAPYTAWFRAPVLFAQDEDALVLTADDLRRPFRAADPMLLPILLRHADDVLARHPPDADLAGDVHRLLVSALAAGDASIEHIATNLGLSARSLQRRLRDADLSFQSLLDGARLSLARRYLSDPSLTLTEAAFLLGYADLSTFSRAFRRWTGTSPQSARRA
jgi:AraC-like DNA-binding protein